MRSAKIINFLKVHKIYILSIILLLIVLALGFSYFSNRATTGKTKLGKGIAFSIDGKDYSKKSVQQLIAYPVNADVGITKDKAAKQAFTMLKQVRTAQKLGYTPSKAELTYQKNIIYQALNLSKEKQTKYDNWFNLVASQAAVNTYVNSPVAIGYTGYSYVFFFGQHLQSSADFKPKGLNDPKLVAQDKAYAKQKANYYHQQLQDNKISPADALSKSGADMQARGHGVNNPNFNTSFSSASGQNLTTAVYMPDIIRYITSRTATGLSGVKTGKAPNAPTKSGGKNVDMYYYFVDLTAAPRSKAINSKQFNQALKKLPAVYGGLS